jgi:serine/threonine-protein kinase
MSSVYLGYDPNGLRPVAVKLLAEHLATNKQFVNRFYREGRMSRLLTHPNLIHGAAYGYDTGSRQHYLILEHVDGPNALTLLDRHGPLPVGLVVRVGIEIGRALGHLHSQNFVHRDVKPDNILFGPDGTAKLGDLGLAKRLTGDDELTTTNQGVGTPHYMPYEQAVNGDLVDGRSDLFALGATLYHLMTGAVPFRGDTHEEIVREKAQDAHLPARDRRSEIPPELDRILARSLARDPRSRYQSAGEFVTALESTDLALYGPISLPETAPAVRTDPEPTGQTRADLISASARVAAGAAALEKPATALHAVLRLLGLPLIAGAATVTAAGIVGMSVYAFRSPPIPPAPAPATSPPVGGASAKLPVPPYATPD